MHAQLIVQSLTCAHGPDVVISDATFTIAADARVGVIGPNGSGKSTLFRTLASLHEPESGSCTVIPSAATVGLMPQQLDPTHATVPTDRWLRAHSGVGAIETELELASAAIGQSADADDRYDLALRRFVAIDPAGFDERVRAMLDEVGLGHVRVHQPVGTLSGGEGTRLLLALVGLSSADVLLLDEPTNGLDSEGLVVLDQLLMRRQGPTAVISHDRAFLSGYVTTVLEVDGHARTVTEYNGGYDAWLEARATARRHAEHAYTEWARTRDELVDRARRQREWSERGVHRARRTQEPDRNVRQYKIETGEQLAAKASRTQRTLDRHDADRVEKPWDGWELRLSFAEAPTAGSDVARLDGAVLQRGSFRLGPIDAVLVSRDRVLLTGANGAGKSTIVDALLGDLEPVEGSSTLGPGTVVGRLGQARNDFGSGPLIDAFIAASGCSMADARSGLAKVGLAADHVERSMGSLSTGELTRARLALFAAREVNTIVLDEPTNHLDLEAIEQLEAALASFGGTLLVITHDRRMIENLDLTRRWHLTDGVLRDTTA